MIVQNDSVNLRGGEAGRSSLIPLGEFPIDPTNDLWARFHFEASSLTFQTSTDGQTWTALLVYEFDWDYSASSFGISASNFEPLVASESLSVRSFEVCLRPAP